MLYRSCIVAVLLLWTACVVFPQLSFANTKQVLWGSSDVFSSDFEKLPYTQWSRVLSRFHAEGEAIPEKWKPFLEYAQALPQSEQLNAVLRFVSLLSYQSDRLNYGVGEYWATPYELSIMGSGDCEDFAFLSFVLLKQLGWDSMAMRLIVLLDKARNLVHAVVVVSFNDTLWLLDSVRSFVIEAKRVQDYTPLYSMNEYGWWKHQSTHYKKPTLADMIEQVVLPN